MRLDLEFDVEAENEEEAQKKAFQYEEFVHFADIYSVEVDLAPAEDDEE